MRGVIVFVNSSVDGFMAAPSGDLRWLLHDDETDHDFTTDLRGTADTILTGRVLFESFAAAWPERAADRSAPSELVNFANWMLDTPKVVFSTRSPDVAMKNSRLSGPTDFGLAWHKAHASSVLGLHYRRRSSAGDVTRSNYVE